MHIRAQNLSIFGVSCSFDASGTFAGSVFDHIERAGASFETAMVVLRRVQGRSYKRFARRYMRLDGPWLAFDMLDGSVLMLMRDVGSSSGQPWLWAVESRTAAEVLIARDFCMDIPFMLGTSVSFDAEIAQDHHGVVLAAAG